MPAVPGFAAPVKALAVAQFGMEEGTSTRIPDREFGLIVDEPAEFRFFCSASRKDDTPGSVKWHKPKLQHLVLAYDEGKSVDQADEDEWEKRREKPKLVDLEFDYDGTSRRPNPDDPDFKKAKNLRLEDLHFGYAEKRGLTPEQLEEMKKAEHKPRLENLDEDYLPGKGKPDDAV